MAPQTHFFLAVSLPNKTRHILEKWRGIIQQQLSFKTWVYPQDYHITLAFLGSATYTQVNTMKNSMRKIIPYHQAFPLSLTDLGVFGQKDAPRVFWCGVEHDQKLFDLQKDIYEACTEIGFSLDKRPYNPHITMARKWVGDDSFEPQMLAKLGKPKDEFCSFLVENIVLYQTHMDQIPKYQPLTVFPLSKI